MRATFFKHVLKFKIPGGTSRGVLNQKESWFIAVKKEKQFGIGECSIIRGLSPDPLTQIETKLNFVCQNIKLGFNELSKFLQNFPSILFALGFTREKIITTFYKFSRGNFRIPSRKVYVFF